MHSYTATGSHITHSNYATAPRLLVECKCKRRFLQEQIYTCLTCADYCCSFCTNLELISMECRNCKNLHELHERKSKCNNCFSCSYCQSALGISRCPTDKKFILLCQFCYWSSKDINIKADTQEQLLNKMGDLSLGFRSAENQIYQKATTFFKQYSNLVDSSNDNLKYLMSHRKAQARPNSDPPMNLCKSLQTLVTLAEQIVPKARLDNTPTEYQKDDRVPKKMNLIARKIRRCPSCNKPVTGNFHTRNNELKTDLLYKDITSLQCQITPAVNNKVKIKLLKNLMIEGIEKQEGNIHQVTLWKYFPVIITYLNKTKNAKLKFVYKCIVQDPKNPCTEKLEDIELPTVQKIQIYSSALQMQTSNQKLASNTSIITDKQSKVN